VTSRAASKPARQRILFDGAPARRKAALVAAKKPRTMPLPDGRVVVDFRDPAEIWSDVVDYIRGVTQPQHQVPESPASAEPHELAAWRSIANYRDRLVLATRAEWSEAAIRQYSDTATRLGATPEQLQAMTRNLREVLAIDAASATERLRELDAAIASRKPDAGVPDKLIEKLHEPKWRAAVATVKAWLDNETESEAVLAHDAWIALCGIANDRGKRELLVDNSVQHLAAEARRELRTEDGSGSRTAIARRIVAKVAGIPLHSRALR
jgi:hypothetical protein